MSQPVNPRRRQSKIRKSAYHHGNLETAVQTETLEFLKEKGVDALSLREIARRLGVTHAAIYRHYRDKQSLLIEIARSGFEQLAFVMQTAATATAVSEEQRLRRAFLAYLSFAKEQSACFRLMYGPELSEREAFPTLSAAVDHCFQVLSSLLQHAQERGEITRSSIDLLAATAFSFAHGLATLEINGLARNKILLDIPRHDLIEHSWAVLWKGLGGTIQD
ncbi:MAG: TetR/AcrR family transcriptional regulator [Proteobacteria bacterium]|nr:TetR/AcrR family transcriptional regulator [Pseudomonadota bacterium]